MSSAREKELAELEIRIRDLSTNQLSSVVDGPKESAETSPIIPPNINALRDLEMHARSISSNIDMALRDLRGSLRGMSDLTLESIQAFSSSINSSCDTVDAAIRSTYSVMAKAEEFSSCMGNVRKLTEQIKNMKNLVDLFENQLLTSESSNKAGSST